MTSEAVRRSWQNDPGFVTASAKVLRWPELANGAGGGEGAGCLESQGEIRGTCSGRDEDLFAVASRAGQRHDAISIEAGHSGCRTQRACGCWGGRGGEVVALEEPGSEASAHWDLELTLHTPPLDVSG